MLVGRSLGVGDALRVDMKVDWAVFLVLSGINFKPPRILQRHHRPTPQMNIIIIKQRPISFTDTSFETFVSLVENIAPVGLNP